MSPESVNGVTSAAVMPWKRWEAMVCVLKPVFKMSHPRNHLSADPLSALMNIIYIDYNDDHALKLSMNK